MVNYILLILPFVLGCWAQFSDHMQVYEEQCLGEERVHCADGSCIWQHQYCDGRLDCADGSDEELCLDQIPDPEVCNETRHYLCADKKRCIFARLLCNNETDCEDGSDEANCTALPESATCKGFQCVSDRRCISKLWACDGSYDCEDQSDEDLQTCRHTERNYRPNWDECPTASYDSVMQRKMYGCLDRSQCFPGGHMCDGLVDCKDGSDEGPFCEHWKDMCQNHSCGVNSTCYPERNGPTCICSDPFLTYNQTNQTCVPVNMCAEAKPYCPQICEDRGGPYMCRCEEGYIPDGFKVGYVCMAPDPEGMLFFSTRNNIKYLKMKTNKMVTVATGIKQAHGVAYDGQYVYWVETAQGHQAIVRARLEDVAGTRQAIVGLGLEDPGDIVIDWLGNHFYFSDARRGVIFVCTLAMMCTTINTDARIPKHLALDVTNGKMYWADWHDKPVIMMANMDGSEASVLVGDLGGFPSGVTVDTPGKRLYYIDSNIMGIRLDTGKKFQAVNEQSQLIHHPYAVTVFENRIYWSDWASDTIQSTDKLTASRSAIVATLDSAVYGLYVYHPILRHAASNPCSNHSCSHFCLLSSNTTHSCACPPGLQLDNTTGTCLNIVDYRPQYVVVGSGSTFLRLQYDALSGDTTRAVSFDIGRVQAMAYDSLRDALYIYDAKWKTIYQVKMSEFSRGATSVLLYMGLDHVVAMDYDYVTDTLYFADAGRKFVEVVSLATGKRAVIHRFDQEVPVSLCVLPDYGKLLVAVTESEQNNDIHIDVFGLDGSGRQHILMNNLKGPHIKLKYSQKLDAVYLADEGNMIIDVMHPLGTGRENYRELSTSVTELAVTENLVLWTSRRSSRLYWSDITDTSKNIRRIELSPFPNTTHLHIQATFPKHTPYHHPCHNNPCSDVCVQTARDIVYPGGYSPIHQGPSVLGFTKQSESQKLPGYLDAAGYKCLCPPGLLNLDGNCTELVACEEYEAFCHNSNMCVSKTDLCDGVKDCEHGEDEEGCAYSTASNTTCKANEILCEDTCIPNNHACSSSITTTTQEPPVCLHSEFECLQDQLCVQRSLVCDGVNDCSDGSDEARSLCSTLNCLHTEFILRALVDVPCLQDGGLLRFFDQWVQSGNAFASRHLLFSSRSECVPRLHPLDSNVPPDGIVDTYRCSSGHCILNSFRCDGEIDCTDGSDELNCANKTCAQGHFQCRNMECVEVRKRCDLQPDCTDNSDEEDCEEPDAADDNEEPENCAEWEHTCELNRSVCLPLTARCNGKPDCPGGTDEMNCFYRCQRNGYRCAQEQLCIPRARVCDARRDCADGSDETPDACSTVNKTSRLYPVQVMLTSAECRDGYRCDNTQCVEWRAVCDRHNDCSDGSDEGGRCLSACSNHTCSYTCQRSPLGPRCRCPGGYQLAADGSSCDDEDECTRDVCSQHCFNTQGSFVCSCHRGYALRSDRRSCKAVKGNMSVLYVTGNSVRSITADGHTAVEYNEHSVASINDMDYDVRRKMLYVSSADAGMLIEVNSTRDRIVITNVGRPTRVTADWVTGNVYFVDNSLPRVRVCHVGRKRCAALQKLPTSSDVTAFVIDPASHRLFYCVTRDLESVIWSSNLAGKHVTQIAVVSNCTGLAVDTFKKRLYVAETGPAHILTLDYEGNRFNEVLTNDPHLQAPHVLAIFEDHIYFLVANSFKLSRCLLFGKKHCELYLQRVFNANTFVIRHESVQRDDIPDFCEQEKCANVCVQGDMAAICLCDDGAVSKDGSCPLLDKKQLPLFNGWTFQDYHKARQISVTLVVTIVVMFTMYICAFFYYHFVYKKRRTARVDYTPVRFQNSLTEGAEGLEGLSPIDTPSSVLLPQLGSNNQEFVNPLQFFRNWRPSFRKTRRPVGTATLEVNMPPLDVSDTESDIDERENKKIDKK